MGANLIFNNRDIPLIISVNDGQDNISRLVYYTRTSGPDWDQLIVYNPTEFEILGYPTLMLDDNQQPHVVFTTWLDTYKILAASFSSGEWQTETVDEFPIGGWEEACSAMGSDNEWRAF